MGSLLQDRLSAILYYIEQWQVNDKYLEDKDGFLAYLKNCDIGCFNVGNTKVWMSYHTEARKQRKTVPELLFNKQRKTLEIEQTRKHQNRKPPENPVYTVDEKQKQELKEIEERLKTQDPLRRKQLNKQ